MKKKPTKRPRGIAENENYYRKIIKEAGICPKCQATDINYQRGDNWDVQMKTDGHNIYYSFECGGCNFRGKEWYSLVFSGYTDMSGGGVYAVCP